MKVVYNLALARPIGFAENTFMSIHGFDKLAWNCQNRIQSAVTK